MRVRVEDSDNILEVSTIQYIGVMTIRVNECIRCLRCMAAVLLPFNTFVRAFISKLLAKSITGNIAICQAFLAPFLAGIIPVSR